MNTSVPSTFYADSMSFIQLQTSRHFTCPHFAFSPTASWVLYTPIALEIPDVLQETGEIMGGFCTAGFQQGGWLLSCCTVKTTFYRAACSFCFVTMSHGAFPYVGLLCKKKKKTCLDTIFFWRCNVPAWLCQSFYSTLISH